MTSMDCYMEYSAVVASLTVDSAYQLFDFWRHGSEQRFSARVMHGLHNLWQYRFSGSTCFDDVTWLRWHTNAWVQRATDVWDRVVFVVLKLFCFQWDNVNRCWCPCFCSLFCVSMVFERLFDVSSQSAILLSRSACHLAGRKVSFENVWPANCLYQDITICVHGISLLMLKSQSAINTRLVILSG